MNLPAECVGRLPPPEFLSPPDLPLLVSQDLLAELAETPFLPESLHRSLLPAVERLSLPEPPSPMALKRLAPSESLSPPAVERLSLPEPPSPMDLKRLAPSESLSPMALKRLAPSESLSPPDLPLLALPAYMLRIFVCISASALAKWSGGNHPYADK